MGKDKSKIFKSEVRDSIRVILDNSEKIKDKSTRSEISEFGRRFTIVSICRALSEIGYDAAWEIRELKKIVENGALNQTSAKMRALDKLSKYAELVSDESGVSISVKKATKNERMTPDDMGKAATAQEGSAMARLQREHVKRHGKEFMEEVDDFDE